VRPTGEWLNQPGGLAERLTRIRKTAGLTGNELAARLGWARSRVPKLENGRQMPTEADITAWAEACGQPSAIPELLEMLTEAQAVHRQWRHKLRTGHAALQAEFDALVREASHIRNFEVMLIPGLLQTPEYARCRMLEAVRLHGFDPAKVDEAVVARMRRQDVLSDTGKTFEFVICEAALSYLLCPREVMRGQLEHLAGMINLPNITFGIIPPGVELPIWPAVGYLMTDSIVTIETFTGMDTLPDEEAVKYAQITDELLAESVTGDEARRLIAATAAALASE
jgi:transcriptional regulator with XRE-family HTH domain